MRCLKVLVHIISNDSIIKLLGNTYPDDDKFKAYISGYFTDSSSSL